MRRIPTFAILLLTACTKAAVAPPAPQAAIVAAAPQPLIAAPAVDAGHAKPAPLTPEEDRALDHYAAFSDDDLAFAHAEHSEGAGLPVLTFYAVPTNTIEKRAVLDSPQNRTQVAEQLAADGFPRPGAAQPLPPGLSASVVDGQVQVTLAGHPAAKPFNPFQGAKAAKASIIGASADGKVAAVFVTGTNGSGEFGPMTSVRFVRLFE